MKFHIQATPLPSVETLNEFFHYKNGKLFNKKRRKGTSFQKEAGNINKAGYRELCLNKQRFLVHRLIWKIKKGSDPRGCLDHINRNRSDNRIENLREVTHQANLCNQRKRVTNTSGYTGVCWDKAQNKWLSSITVNGKTIHLGRFTRKKDALIARKNAEKKFRS